MNPAAPVTRIVFTIKIYIVNKRIILKKKMGLNIGGSF